MTASHTPDSTEDDKRAALDGARRIAKRRNRSRFAIPKVAFRRLVTEIVADRKSDLRLQGAGLDALQESAENMVAEHFAKCSRVAELCRLDTIRAEHWHFARGVGGAGGQPAGTTLLG